MSRVPRLAIAFDLGTTTIAAALSDPLTGERLATTGVLNPQRKFGLDVVSRLDSALHAEGALLEMKRAVNQTLQQMALELLANAGVPATDLRLLALAGNPAMEHILLGIPVKSLAFPPYRPLFTSGRTINSVDLGWETRAETYIFPLPGGFVGGDLVAFLFGQEMEAARNTQQGARLYLDLGTNGEIALVQGEKIFATSAAAGPAFEGGNLSCGMAALPGAICGLHLEEDRVRIDTIGHGSPQGICGSGVMAAISELLQAGIIDPTGRLRPQSEISSNLANQVTEVGGETVFVLHRDARGAIGLGQNDIRQVQLAKAAIRAGIQVLFERSGIAADDVLEVIITGSFGATLEPGSLKNVGILPEKMVDISGFVREGALAGVEKAICSTGGIGAVEALAKGIRVIPLSGTPLFEKHFLEHMNFPLL